MGKIDLLKVGAIREYEFVAGLDIGISRTRASFRNC